jgi:basic amino acid/polyamine antiporter, APA family
MIPAHALRAIRESAPMSRDQPPAELARSVGFVPAAAIVVANMIGAGIFTTTGFQAEALGHPGYILALWLLGGVLALSGALCYAELGAAMPKAGGEYLYLREAFGGSFALMSAVVSLTAGFSAPIASALKSVCHYLAIYVPALAPGNVAWLGLSVADLVAIGLVWVLVAAHARETLFGLGLTGWMTAVKVAGIVVLLVAAAAVGRGELAHLTATAPGFADKSGTELLGAFATSLIFVSFCYSGWNSAAYLAGELKRPERDLPRALLVGTGVVTVLYLALNVAYFYGADVTELAGRVEVAQVASAGLFGPVAAGGVSILLAVSLLASASAMTAVGPRVYYAAGRDHARLGALARVNPRTRTPVFALVVQGLVTSVVIVLGKVDQIQQYAGFTLSLFATLAVTSLIVLRVRRPAMPRPFRATAYPLTPILFISVSVWTMVWAFRGRPVESTLGLVTVAVAGLLHTFLGGASGRGLASEKARKEGGR